MAAKFLASIACLLALTQANGLQVNSVGKIKITVHTTSGCGDTVAFIRNQMTEAYRLYGQFLDIEFVPWGKSTWDGVGAISCQFGANDCWANRLHRCVLNMLKDNQAAQMHYMSCEFSPPYPSYTQGSYLCAQAVGVKLTDLDFCVANNHDDLDKAAQAAAAAPMAAFYYVPTIVFNDVMNREENDEAEIRLASMICFALAADPKSGITSCQI